MKGEVTFWSEYSVVLEEMNQGMVDKSTYGAKWRSKTEVKELLA